MMKIKSKSSTATVNTLSNWPLIVDLFIKWGFSEELVEEARDNKEVYLNVPDMENVTSELSAWGIPWKRDF